MSEAPTAIQSFFVGKDVLVIDPSRKLRTLIKKMLVDAGVPLKQMIFSEEFHESLKMIQSGRGAVVFSTMRIQTHPVQDLIHAHLNSHPAREKTLFFLIVDQNASLAERFFHELKVDGLFIPPLNGGTVINTFQKALQRKCSSTSEGLQYNEGLKAFFSENFSSAEEFLGEIPNCKNPNVFALLGICQHRREDIEGAKNSFNRALALEPYHFLALEELTKIYLHEKKLSEAYDLKKRFLSRYQADEPSYPELIRLSLSVGALDDVIKYGEKYLEFDERTSNVQRSVAAGLAAVGKVVIRNDPKRGRDVLKKAALLGMNQPTIIESALSSLVEHQHFSLAEEILNEALILSPNEPAFEVVRLRLFARKAESCDKVLVKGSELMARGIRSPDIYRLMIDSALKVGKTGEFLNDLIFQAGRDFPELTSEFQHLKR